MINGRFVKVLVKHPFVFQAGVVREGKSISVTEFAECLVNALLVYVARCRD